MEDSANKEQADKCLDIARQALAANDLGKAQRFGEKAMKLAPNDEVGQQCKAIWAVSLGSQAGGLRKSVCLQTRMLMRAVRSRTAGPSSSGASTSSAGPSLPNGSTARRRAPPAAPAKARPRLAFAVRHPCCLLRMAGKHTGADHSADWLLNCNCVSRMQARQSSARWSARS